MGFLKGSQRTEIKIIVPLSAEETSKVQPHIETIFNNLAPDEFELLAKAVKNPLIKNMALAELRKRL